MTLRKASTAPRLALSPFAAVVFALLILCAAPHASAQKEKGAGATVSGEATAKDVGLPLYPGSKRHRDKDNDTDANFGLWGGGSGLKLIVLKMESTDPPDKVADFYKKALAKYGSVLDCSRPSDAAAADKDDNSKTLTCGSDKAEPGGKLYKAGNKDSQHMVSVKPDGTGTVFDLLYIASWSDDKKK